MVGKAATRIARMPAITPTMMPAVDEPSEVLPLLVSALADSEGLEVTGVEVVGSEDFGVVTGVEVVGSAALEVAGAVVGSEVVGSGVEVATSDSRGLTFRVPLMISELPSS